MDLDVIKMLDSKNDFYFNIMPPTFKDDNIDLLIECSHIKDVIEKLDKPDYLLDYFDKIYLRRKKLKRINKIANGI